MDDIGGWIELNASTLADKNNLAPLACGANRHRASRGTSGTFDRTFNTKPVSQVPDLRDISFRSIEKDVAQLEVSCNLQALRQKVDTDDLLRSEFPAQGCGCKSGRAQSRNQHDMISANSDLLDPFVNSSKPTRRLGAML